jgi:hypothetical protein
MGLSDRGELITQRRNTVSYIDAAYSEIVLHRRTPHKNERGGADITPTVLAPQRMRILHGYVGRRANQNAPNDTSMGKTPYAKNVLIARWDADVERGDWFVEDGVEYQVDYIFSNNREFELLANLTDTGPEVSG